VIEIVAATRLSESEFWKQSALGQSLRRLESDERLVPRPVFVNQRGLPDIFNARISAADGHDLLVFVHDDVWIDDYYVADRVIEGLKAYDVIGVAGNRRRVPNQPAWAFLDDKYTWDSEANLSGCVAHGSRPFGPVTYYGAAPAECELLDGVFLAARKAVLKDRGVLFDPRFEFHFYDMDFCRSAREKGLRLGTWPICLTHQSGGTFGAPKWRETYHRYIEKWGA
jgi:GT2 family glycosyltransferase